ncbi:D-ribose ABC transporter substrate-binding protein [soil metagenome]
MITVKRTAALGVAALIGVAGLLAGCTTGGGGGDASAGGECSIDGKNVQFVSMLRENPVIQIWAAGFSSRAEELGATHTELLSQGDNPQDAITLAQQALAQGSDGMVVVAFDPQWYPLIQEAKDAGVPVVVTHFPIDEGAAPGVVANIATDVAAYGAAAAQAIGTELGGVGTVAVTQGSFNNTEDLAASSFTEELNASFPDIKVLAPEVEGFDVPQAIATNSSILQANPDVNAAFSTTGGGAQTWAAAADDTSRDVTIIGMDYTRPNLELVEAGRVFGLVAQPLFEENSDAVDALEEIICGGEVEYRQFPEAPIITSANVQQYFDLLDKIGQ